jgi:hypothetical protein
MTNKEIFLKTFNTLTIDEIIDIMTDSHCCPKRFELDEYDNNDCTNHTCYQCWYRALYGKEYVK